MKLVKSIDLWNDHKPSQSIDPFLIDYFDEESLQLAYDEVVIAPNLVGNYQVVNPDPSIGELDFSLCPNFYGGIIFLRNNKPIRLYLCQVNDIVEKEIGHKYGVQEIMDVIASSNLIGNTGLTLSDILHKNNVSVKIDDSIVSKHVSQNGYLEKNDVVLESADSMAILTGPTFLDNVNNWEAVSYNPDLVLNVGVITKDYIIDIEHKGYLVGIKKNIKGLRDTQQGKKLYGIALQTAKTDEYEKMVEYANIFCKQVGNQPAKDTYAINLDESLLDL